MFSSAFVHISLRLRGTRSMRIPPVAQETKKMYASQSPGNAIRFASLISNNPYTNYLEKRQTRHCKNTKMCLLLCIALKNPGLFKVVTLF
jgi:hypothetical protein